MAGCVPVTATPARGAQIARATVTAITAASTGGRRKLPPTALKGPHSLLYAANHSRVHGRLLTITGDATVLLDAAVARALAVARHALAHVAAVASATTATATVAATAAPLVAIDLTAKRARVLADVIADAAWVKNVQKSALSRGTLGLLRCLLLLFHLLVLCLVFSSRARTSRQRQEIAAKAAIALHRMRLPAAAACANANRARPNANAAAAAGNGTVPAADVLEAAAAGHRLCHAFERALLAAEARLSQRPGPDGGADRLEEPVRRAAALDEAPTLTVLSAAA